MEQAVVAGFLSVCIFIVAKYKWKGAIAIAGFFTVGIALGF